MHTVVRRPALRCSRFVLLPVLAVAVSIEGRAATWRERLVEHLAAGEATAVSRTAAEFPDQRLALDVVADWIAQASNDQSGLLGQEAIKAVLGDLGPSADPLRGQYDALVRDRVAATDRRWAELFLRACEKRRDVRLAPWQDKIRRVVFTKHYDLGGSHYAYTEGQSDAQRERHFVPGAALCLFELEGTYGRVHTLLADRGGVIRDPDVSFDGRRVLFAWKKSLDEDDYHLYELDVAGGKVRQITWGKGFADYEGAYLPGGGIVFNSTRCVQTVDCWWTEVSNLFTCDGQGRFLRQISFDQVHTNYPTLTADGRVIYTRWDYNDRGQIYPQGLFRMNPDGTGQTELYGNNSFFPTTILHARSIPGTSKIVCIFTGHHTRQRGQLGVLDPRLGRQENEGAQLIAPIRPTPAVRIDRYGQKGDQFQYPYPLDDQTFLVTFRPEKSRHFGIYWMTIDGRRELLAADPEISCNQPVPLTPRPEPPLRPSTVDYRRSTGTIYLHNVYEGPGLRGVEPGTIKGLRVVALEFRAAGIGSNRNHGSAGSALVSTPISIAGAWDVKRVLGTVPVQADGSACFTVPARTPLYFQALDAGGRMVQTMRSWVSLQPGESVSCIGCHENKNTAPPITFASLAMKGGPQPLVPFYGPPRGFSFIREIQPILDRKCIGCHHLDEPPKYADRAGKPLPGHSAATEPVPAFSLLGRQTLDKDSQRKWSDAYKALADRRVTNWIDIQSGPQMLPPYSAGASQSRLIDLLDDGRHYGVRLSKAEMDRFVAWIDLLVPYAGDYTEAMSEDRVAEYRKFLDKRARWQAEERRNIEEFLAEP